ncbi:hypothetical protein [Enterococcus sp. AZ072]|uniref:hypothetical protein n=1 Tax=unclassified Enterococcus TaxID=2608891 RepID=UPI003D29082E
MNTRDILVLFCCGMILIGSTFLCYYLYSLVLIDAKARGLERPKFWALVSLGGQSGGGLLLYLFKRRNYDVHLTPQEQAAMDQLKRKILAIFVMMFLAVIFFIFAMMPKMV